MHNFKNILSEDDLVYYQSYLEERRKDGETRPENRQCIFNEYMGKNIKITLILGNRTVSYFGKLIYKDDKIIGINIKNNTLFFDKKRVFSVMV